jgi:DNA-binding transcriptional regulator LsrR (DeoR family)
LKKISGLTYCVVVPAVPNLIDALSRGTAHLCNDIIGIKGSLGFGFSRSLGRLDLYLKKEKCNIRSVVSLCGTTSPNLALRSFNSGFHIAQALDVDFYTILSPMIVSPELNSRVIKKDRYISMVLEMAESVDIALVGIGNADDSQLTDSKYISEDDYKHIVSSNAVGEIIAHYFTLDGKITHTQIDDRLISVDFPMKCPVIAAAGGPAKIRSIVGAIRSGFIQGLVTDEKTAEAVIKILNIVDTEIIGKTVREI